MARSKLLVALGFLAFACAGDRSEPAVVASGALELRASVTPKVIRVGANQLWIELRDAQGKPVANAAVAVKVHMASMGAMPPMGGPASVAPQGPGVWRADFDLPMSGTWQVEIEAKQPSGERIGAEGSLTVGTPGLRLEPAEHQEAQQPTHPGEFSFDESRLRQVGVRSEPARREAFGSTLRAVGRVALDERKLRDVTLRIGGFADRVEADALGARVAKGQVLFWLYSPELYAAQAEYLQALRSQQAAHATGAPDRADALVRASARRLQLWDLDAADVARIASRGAPEEYLPVRAPVTGYVIEKNVVAGSAVPMGQRLYRIAPLDTVWIEAEVYESELERVAVGQAAEVTLPYHPGERLEATVAYVYPTLDPARRTARVRLELANPDLALRPDMYANVFLKTAVAQRLSVPDTAVLRAGDRSFVFLDLGGGRLRPQRVEVGLQSEGRVEILAGLEEGQPVVVAGTFLVAGESRLRAALESW